MYNNVSKTADERKFFVEEEAMASRSSPVRRRAGHSPLHIAYVIVTSFVFAAVLLFKYYNRTADGVLFINTTGNTSDFFYFEITPASWSFSIWGFIYLMQFAFLAYSVASLFRSTSYGPLYRVPSFLPLLVYRLYSLNLVINIAWLFAFDRKIIILSFFLLAALSSTIIACMILCFWKTDQNIRFFKNEGQRYEMILLNIFVYNAWAAYLGWTICAALLNFGIMLIYSLGVGQEIAGIVTLTILLLIIAVLCPLEMTIFDKHLRYVVMHYLGPLVALSGSINKAGLPNSIGHVPSGMNREFAAGMLATLLIVVVIKFINIGLRMRKSPLYYDKCPTKRQNGSRTYVKAAIC